MSTTAIRPIETMYRGYRFRSRLEARWAVFFDAAGIEWQYEVQGYTVGGVNYLPDLWLPRLKTFVEIKPTEEAYLKNKSVMFGLVQATGHRGVFAIGSPNMIEPPKLLQCFITSNGRELCPRIIWKQCLLCNRLIFGLGDCDCLSIYKPVGGFYNFPTPRLYHALGEAQRARFEHSEDGKPRPYTLNITTRLNVYVAGAVLETERCTITVNENGGVGKNEEQESENVRVLPWRHEIFQADQSITLHAGEALFGRFRYAGPSITETHGQSEHGLADNCLAEVKTADALFAWIDRQDTIGTMVEIGAARALGKPIFVAFANEELCQHFYFAKQLATVAVIAPSARIAWKCFTHWHDLISAPTPRPNGGKS
jgi:hypothetical protein